MSKTIIKKPLFSIVIPVYMAENILEELVRLLSIELTAITDDFEIILVNDSSPDISYDKILLECKKDHRVKGINLSRNFGQHYAITAGLSFSKGDWIVVMDCDLQDRPDEIINLYHKAISGYDIVLAKRTARQDSFFKKLSSELFHQVNSYFSGMKSDKSIANFGIFNEKVIHEFNQMPEMARSFMSLINTLGYKRTELEVKHSERYEGETSYTLMKLLNLSLDVILSNSNRPLKLTVKLGFLVSFLCTILAFYNLIAKKMGLIEVEGFTSTIFSIWFVGGIIMFILGIVGLYIGKIFDQVKGRKLFIVDEVINITK